MSKVYLLIPVNLEYNDEWYYEQGLEAPKRAFASKKTAEDALYEENKRSILAINHYYDAPEGLANELGLEEDEDLGNLGEDSFTPTGWRKRIKAAGFPYFRLFEVETEE